VAGVIVSARIVLDGRIGLFDFFLALVAEPGSATGPDRGADDGTRRSGHGAADESPGGPATERTRAGSGLVVSLARLARDRTGDGTDAAADHGSDRATDGHPDGRAAERAGTGADRLTAMLFVLGCGPGAIARERRVDRIVVLKVPAVVVRLVRVRLVSKPRVVAVHVGLLNVWEPAVSPDSRRRSTSICQP
jgi:hypothetical protein